MSKFEAGKKYQTRSIGDNNCIFEITVIKRTIKTVTYKQWDGRERRTNIQHDAEGEFIQPDRYSFAPTYRANREAA